jgi:hypothetical protein
VKSSASLSKPHGVQHVACNQSRKRVRRVGSVQREFIARLSRVTTPVRTLMALAATT